MPNPLARIGGRTKGRPEIKPEALAPVLESVEGDDWNNPYRGMEDHGVDPTDKASFIPNFDGQPDEEYDKPEKEPADPIAVRVVNQSAKEGKRFRVAIAYATNGGALIVNRNETRSKVSIKNASTNTPIFISERIDLATEMNGWPLAGGERLELSTDQEVYAGTNSADPIKVLILSEYGS